MKYCVETINTYMEFATYREAEIYCGEHNISCEDIYEI